MSFPELAPGLAAIALSSVVILRVLWIKSKRRRDRRDTTPAE